MSWYNAESVIRMNMIEEQKEAQGETITEFGMYIDRPHIVDMTYKMLVRYVAQTSDQQRKMLIFALLKDYVEGKVAIAWKAGRPVYVAVEK